MRLTFRNWRRVQAHCWLERFLRHAFGTSFSTRTIRKAFLMLRVHCERDTPNFKSVVNAVPIRPGLSIVTCHPQNRKTLGLKSEVNHQDFIE